MVVSCVLNRVEGCKLCVEGGNWLDVVRCMLKVDVQEYYYEFCGSLLFTTNAHNQQPSTNSKLPQPTTHNFQHRYNFEQILNIKPKMHDIAILHYIGFAFNA